jgi:hypothetical protein
MKKNRLLFELTKKSTSKDFFAGALINPEKVI